MIDCVFEDGGKTKLRHAVVDAIVLNAARDSVLLIKRAPHLSNGNRFAFPGGFLDFDETTKEAVVRELKEETGYEGTVLERFDIIDNPQRRDDDRQNIAFIFVVEAGTLTGKPDDEVAGLDWYPFNKLPPAEQFAFDHYDILQRYLKTLRK